MCTENGTQAVCISPHNSVLYTMCQQNIHTSVIYAPFYFEGVMYDLTE